MDSLDFGHFPNIYGNQGALRIQQSFSENSIELDDIDVLNDPTLSINGDAKSRIFIGPNSDDDDRYKFFMVCAENKINALIERVREFSGDFERPEEFENEAVSMAIQQHGLRKSGAQDRTYDYDHGKRANSSHTTKSWSAVDVHTPTTSNNARRIIENDGKSEIKKKKFDDCSKSQNKGVAKVDVDDMFFLNEAVAAAIKQKGLSRSRLDI